MQGREQPSIGLLALDLDGTLLNSESKLTRPNLKALARVHDSGIHLAIVTGRRYWVARRLTAEIRHPHRLVTNAGAQIATSQDEVLASTPWERTLLEQFLDFLGPHTRHTFRITNAKGNGEILCDDPNMEDPHVARYVFRNDAFILRSDRLARDGRSQVLQLVCSGTVERMKALRARANAFHGIDQIKVSRTVVKDNIAPDHLPVALGAMTELSGLEPGDRQDVIYDVVSGDGELTVFVLPEVTAACQTTPAFFGDELQLAIHTVKTSTVGPTGQYYDLNPAEGFEHAFIGPDDMDFSNVSGVLPGACTGSGCSFDIETPEPGLLRVSVSSATTNSCNMDADVVISQKSASSSTPLLISGSVDDLDTVSADTIDVLPGAGEIEFELSWINEWTHTKGSDLELLVFLPGFPFPLPFGQTLDAPEKFSIDSEILTALLGSKKPVPLPAGIWTMQVFGFEVNKENEDWELRVTIDGTPVVTP